MHGKNLFDVACTHGVARSMRIIQLVNILMGRIVPIQQAVTTVSPARTHVARTRRLRCVVVG